MNGERKGRRGMKFTADFETTTLEEDCRVWAWATCTIDNKNRCTYGNDMESFIAYCKKLKNPKIYFHNLKFDGYFIVDYLLKNGFTLVEKDEKIPNTFTTLITDVGAWYSITIRFSNTNKATIFDSLKILNMSVAQVAKSFGLDCQKLDLDYTTFRSIGHQLTAQEKDYITNDVLIMAKALFIMFQKNLTKITIAADALHFFKSTIGKDDWDEFFPLLDHNTDRAIRDSYRGGYVYVNPKYQGQDIQGMLTLDVNSLYPSVMYECNLPVGNPIYFDGKYKNDEWYPLYVQSITCNFKLKEKHLPTLQIKGNPKFLGTEYLTESGEEPVTVTLTNIDLTLFFEHYDVYHLQYNYGYKFRSEKGLFKNYIDYWMKEKEEATVEGNKGRRQIAKLLLNSLYGKFGKNPIQGGKYPVLEGDKVVLKNAQPDEGDGIYIPVASFITSYARNKTIRAAQSNYARFVYADTDSLHLVGEEVPKGMEIHSTKLGAWDMEEQGYTGRYIRPKTYLHWDRNGIQQIKACGMSSGCYENVTIENFHAGTIYKGKLRPKVVPGGVILEDCEFTIKH